MYVIPPQTIMSIFLKNTINHRYRVDFFCMHQKAKITVKKWKSWDGQFSVFSICNIRGWFGGRGWTAVSAVGYGWGARKSGGAWKLQFRFGSKLLPVRCTLCPRGAASGWPRHRRHLEFFRTQYCLCLLNYSADKSVDAAPPARRPDGRESWSLIKEVKGWPDTPRSAWTQNN